MREREFYPQVMTPPQRAKDANAAVRAGAGARSPQHPRERYTVACSSTMLIPARRMRPSFHGR
ncbi:hypothetical protein CEJ86_22465 [Sinorhizobium meliloti]|uniref:Uncharacterized protein n=1 Tax=Rhizobium meliloti TaxID=382 RepID=A0A2J0YY04_RHIML|nr:hypothetical protein CEJ86_22465 [Sinorhizobium meliloti]